jgi:TonB-dependent starch-binding outer membrane protein SusC
MKQKFIFKFLLVFMMGFAGLCKNGAIAKSIVRSVDQKVTGTVTDENGQGLPGVNVIIKGSLKGTTSDVSGNYNIDVPDKNSILVFSFTGYLTVEKIVGSQSLINVKLEVDAQTLEQVVVVGYGTQRKVDLTGSVGSITGKDIVSRPYTNPDQILGGRVAGVHIANRSGDPGAPIDVRIRGVGTTGNNQPLWVIDGVPIVQTSNITVNTASYTESNPMAGINPADIESMDILKDASAAAIYGARAANGVVIVTTKRGKEGRTSATYDGYYGVQMVQKGRKLSMLTTDQYIGLQKELGRDFSKFSGQPTFDWQDALFQTGAVKNHNLTISGGTQTLNFNVAGGYHGQDGVEIGQDFQRYSFKANVDAKVGKFLKFGESALLTSTDRLTQSEGGNFAAFNGARNAPYFQPFDSFGNYNESNGTTRGDGASASNYLWATDTKYNETRVKNKKILGNIYGEFEPIKGLKYRLSVGLDYNVADGFFFQEKEPLNFGTAGTPGRSSLLVQERPIEQTTNTTNTLTYNKKLGKGDLTLLAGYEETNFRFDKVRLQGRDLFNSNIRFASVATTVAGANEADIWALRGILGRVFYSYNDKYLITANVRRDESSRFSPENRAGIFPSVSVGWKINKEKFLSNYPSIEEWKLRGSWGQSGNQFTGQNFAYLPSLTTTIFYVSGAGQTVVRGPSPTVFANKDLKWETSTQIDFGTDLSLYGGKFSLTADYFQKTSNDVLLSLPIPMTSGYFLPADANLGQIKNKGFEVAIDFRNRIGDLKYSIGGNITSVKNEVTSLGGIPEIISGTGGGQSHRTSVGEPIGYFYGYKTNGIYQSQAEIDADKTIDANSSKRSPGDIRFVDVNGDGKIDANDRTNIGSSIPGFYYGINGSLAYKGLDLSILFQGVGKVKIYNSARAGLENMRDGGNQLATVLDRWTSSNPSTSIPRATSDDANNNNRYSDRWIENGSYVRIKNLQIGYTIPGKAIDKIPGKVLSGSRLFIGVQNLLTITKYKGYDPEVTRGASFQKGEFALANGQDSGGSPQPTIYQFGWQLNF